MTEYVGCEHARDMLDAFLDDELSMAEQVAMESHLRWCRTCALRVEDMRQIGASLRLGSPLQRSGTDDARAVAEMVAGTLIRVRAERDASFAVRLRELFVDMRLFWPALGASAAVAICIGVAGAVLQASTAQRPESLAAIIGTLSNPGSERNPRRPDGGNTIPRMLDDEPLAGIPSEDGVFWLHAVVGRDGRIVTLESVQTDRAGSHYRTASHDQHVEAVLDAARQLRFAPAQTPTGDAVAVNMGWLIVMTTATKEEAAVAKPRTVEAKASAPHPPVVEPAVSDVAAPVGRTSATARSLTTA